jgi:hypothetical protein
MFSHSFWRRYFQEVNVGRLATLHAVLKQRLLPCFEGIAEEADLKATEAMNNMTAMPGDEFGPTIGPDEAHEIARGIGLDHYEALDCARQSLINSFAVTMYHLWEQQVIAFLRREILHPAKKNAQSKLSIAEFQRQMLRIGIDVTLFASWQQLQVFRLLANAVKHAEGSAAAQLRAQKPEWFTPAAFRSDPLQGMLMSSSLYEPLAGEDLYLGAEDLEPLVRHARDFWTELADSLEAISRRRWH